jgi:hypothetical protein
MNCFGLGVLLASAALLNSCDETKDLAGLQKGVTDLEKQVVDLSDGNKARETSFNACILESMKGVTSDLAAQSIKEACIRTAEDLIPTTVWAGVLQTAKVGYGPIRGYGDNRAGFGVTSAACHLDSTALATTRGRLANPRAGVLTPSCVG